MPVLKLENWYEFKHKSFWFKGDSENLVSIKDSPFLFLFLEAKQKL